MINQNCIIVKSPGRINLIGEHIDYNGGHVLPAAIDRKVTMWFRKKDNSLCRVNSEDEGAFTFDINKPLQISDTHWENYVLGVVDGGGINSPTPSSSFVLNSVPLRSCWTHFLLLATALATAELSLIATCTISSYLAI